MKTIFSMKCSARGQRMKNPRGVTRHLFKSGAFLLILAQCLLTTDIEAATSRTAPSVAVAVEPQENGSLVYLPIVRETASQPPSNLFGLRLQMTNNETNDVRLVRIRLIFTFQDNAVLGFDFDRSDDDVTIAAGTTGTEYLKPDEAIKLPEPAPKSVRINLFFDGYGSPVSLERNLAIYEPPVSGGSYLFPGNAADLGQDEYFSHVDPHTGGSQFFGYDLSVQGWNGQSFSGTKPGGDSQKNEDKLAWNVPIYAMADGVVISASVGWEDNPAPGKRVVQRMGDYTSEPISDVQVTKLTATRAATVSRLPSGALKITVWDLEDTGRVITPKGSAVGETVEDIAADALTGSRLVTAVRTASGSLRVISWGISSDGMTITREGERDAGAVNELSLTKLTSSQFATAVRTQEDTLRLIVWGVSGGGSTITRLDHKSAGTASSVSTVSLNATRLATTVRTAAGALKVIIWDFEGGTNLVRRGDSTADQISKAAAAKVSENQVAAAMRTAAGKLKVIQWTVSDDGETVTKEREVTAGSIQDLAAPAVSTFSSSDNIMTPVITQDGNYKNILWRQPDVEDGEDAGLLLRFGEREAGTADKVSLDTLDDAQYVSAVRTAGGNLKVITWWAGSGGGNNVVILHGNCRVLYAHFKNGTVDPAVTVPGARVAAGQFLGRIGSSGRSSGPHCHIHAERVPSGLSVEQIIALEAADSLTLVAYRPMPFRCARGMRLNAIQPGGENASGNSFSALTGHGVYFAQFGVRPAWLKEAHVDASSSCPAPEGRKNCVQIGNMMAGGPFPTVNAALNAPCWGHKLFIHGGSYNEAVTFNRRIIVRAYEGTALIGQ